MNTGEAVALAMMAAVAGWWIREELSHRDSRMSRLNDALGRQRDRLWELEKEAGVGPGGRAAEEDVPHPAEL